MAFGRADDGRIGFVPASRPRALETDEVARVVEDFATAARNAMAAGFDGVELHAANGYLFDQFLNPHINDRTDRYSAATIEGRMRFTLEVVDAVSVAIGAHRVGIRLTPYGVIGSVPMFDDAEETYVALPTMRRQRSGHIITISSIAGLSGGAGSSIYCASKHAVSGWSEALAEELEPFGIRVTCVYPGRFRTDFLDRSSVRYGDIPIADYADFSAERMKSLDANNHLQAGDPQKFALAIVELASSDEPPIWLAGGSEGYRVFIAKADALRDNAGRWKDVSLSLDVED